MIIQNMAYDQQIQKQETDKSNIVNPKTKLTTVDLNFFELDLSSSQITQSPLTDEPSSTMSTGSRSSALDSKGWEWRRRARTKGIL